MSYDEIDGFIEAFPPCYDTAEGDAEQAAHHQKTLDVLWVVGNTYDIRIDHMRQLCDVAGTQGERNEQYGPMEQGQSH